MKREFSAQPMKGKRWSIIPVIMVLIAVFVLCAVAWTLLGQAPTEANESIATLEPSEGNKTVYPLPAQPMSLDQKYGSVYKLIFVEAGYFDDVPSICMEYFEAIEYAGQDMKYLQPGDTIMIDNEPVVVEEIKWMDTAMCTIIERGNLEAYNFYLIHTGNYTSSIEQDVNASGVRLESIGRATLPVSSDFVFVDCSTNTKYSFDELMALGQNPQEVLKDVQVTEIGSKYGVVTEMSCGFADILEDPTQDTTGEADDGQTEDNEEMVNSYIGVLTPIEGEFLTETENYDIVASSEGDRYGYIYGGGCSVWCVIEEFEESAVASSVLAPQGGHTYVAKNIISQDRGDAWVEGVEGYGIGEYISITQRYNRGSDEYGFSFTGLCIVNGMAKDERLWKANSRVKTLKMYFNEEYICDLELLDTMKPQYFSLDGLLLSAANNENSVFTFEIVDVYKGDVYADTVITGIEIDFDTPNH